MAADQTDLQALAAPHELFAVQVVSHDGAIVVSVRGEIDITSAPLLWEHLDAAFAELGSRLVIDLSGTTFIDSSALSVFIRAFKHLRDTDAQLVLRAPNGWARKVLQISGLDTLMTVEDTGDGIRSDPSDPQAS